MLLFFTFIGIVLSAILFYYNASKYPSAILLSLFLFLISLYTFFDYVMLYSKSATLIYYIILLLPWVVTPVYLAGPLLLLYMRSVLSDKVSVSKKDFLHFIPALVFFILTVPNLFQSSHERLVIANAIAEDINAITIYKTSLFAELLSVPVAFLSRPLMVFVYSLYSLWILIRFLLKHKRREVFARQQFMIKWLFVLLSFVIIFSFSQVLLMVFTATTGQPVFYSLQVVILFSRIGLIGLLISPLFFPYVLYGLPRQSVTTFNSENIQKNRVPNLSEEKKYIQKFEKEYLWEIGEKVELCMKKEKPYLQSDCNISDISCFVNVPVHHLSYYFREELKQNFNSYRNEWRVEYAKNYLAEGKSPKMTLEAIGLLSGFPSRNAFFTAFKKKEGVSPELFNALQ